MSVTVNGDSDEAPPRPPLPEDDVFDDNSEGTDTEDDKKHHRPLEEELTDEESDSEREKHNRNATLPLPPKPPRSKRHDRRQSSDLATTLNGVEAQVRRNCKPAPAKKPSKDKVEALLRGQPVTKRLDKPPVPKKRISPASSLSRSTPPVSEGKETIVEEAERQDSPQPPSSDPGADGLLQNGVPSPNKETAEASAPNTPQASQRALLPPGYNAGQQPKVQQSLTGSTNDEQQPEATAESLKCSDRLAATPPLTSRDEQASPVSSLSVSAQESEVPNIEEQTVAETEAIHHRPAPPRPVPPPKKGIRWENEAQMLPCSNSPSPSSQSEEIDSEEKTPRCHTDPPADMSAPKKPPRKRSNTTFSSRSPTPDIDRSATDPCATSRVHDQVQEVPFDLGAKGIDVMQSKVMANKRTPPANPPPRRPNRPPPLHTAVTKSAGSSPTSSPVITRPPPSRPSPPRRPPPRKNVALRRSSSFESSVLLSGDSSTRSSPPAKTSEMSDGHLVGSDDEFVVVNRQDGSSPAVSNARRSPPSPTSDNDDARTRTATLPTHMRKRPNAIAEELQRSMKLSPSDEVSQSAVPWKRTVGLFNRAAAPSPSAPSTNEGFSPTSSSRWNFLGKRRDTPPTATSAAPSAAVSTEMSSAEAGQVAIPRLRHVESQQNAARVEEAEEEEDVDSEYDQLFQYVFVVALRERGGRYEPFVTYRFPPKLKYDSTSADDDESLQSIPAFCFPDIERWTKPVTSYKSETFSFILTDIEGGKRFGYCRRMLPCGDEPRLPEVYCMISPLGCFSLYATILDMVEQRRAHSPSSVYTFLKAVIAKPFPAPGRSVTVQSFAMSGQGMEEVVLRRPNDSAWLEHVDFDVLFSQLTFTMVVKVFAAMLFERHLIFVAERLSTLSSCILACTALLYPLEWQHVFIPVLPHSLIDICCSPMPYVIGMMRSCLPSLQDGELPMEDDVLIVDLDRGKFLSSGSTDMPDLPNKLRNDLESALRAVESKKSRPHHSVAGGMKKLAKQATVPLHKLRAAKVFHTTQKVLRRRRANGDDIDQMPASATLPRQLPSRSLQVSPVSSRKVSSPSDLVSSRSLLSLDDVAVISPDTSDEGRSEANVVIVDAFVNFFVHALGHYKKHFKVDGGELIFQEKAFLQAAPKGVNAFLKVFVQSQMFNVFIQERSDTARLPALSKGLFEQKVSSFVGKDDSRTTPAKGLSRQRLRSQVRQFSAASFGKLKKTVTTAKGALQAQVNK